MNNINAEIKAKQEAGLNLNTVEKLWSQVKTLAEQHRETVDVLQKAADLIEKQDDEIKHLKGRVDRCEVNIVKIQKPGS